MKQIIKKTFHNVIMIILLFGAIGCQFVGVDNTSVNDGNPKIENIKKIELLNDIPYFSPMALYAIQREYEYRRTNISLFENNLDQFNQYSLNYDEYLESRLIDLYPDVAYEDER